MIDLTVNEKPLFRISTIQNTLHSIGLLGKIIEEITNEEVGVDESPSFFLFIPLRQASPPF